MSRFAFALLTALACMPVCAQVAGNYPSKPVRFIVPAPPGGANDIIARLFAERLSERLGQPFIVDNRPGATGNIATEIVVRAPPDGYTMHIGNATIFIVNPLIFRKLSFDAGKETVPAALMAQITNGLVVSGKSPLNSVAELIAMARANPGKLNFGSGGNGTTAHLFGELLMVRTGIQMTHVPFKGTGIMLTDLIAGRIDLALENLPAVRPLVQSGQLRALAVTSGERWPLTPELPTLQEQGVQDFNILSWFGIFLPAKTPRPILERLNEAVNAAVREPDVIKRLEGIGARPLAGSLDESVAFIARERRAWVDAVNASKLKID